MTIHIIGCGDSAINWDGSGISIGVNDSWKINKPTASLMVLNRKETFPEDRLKTILSSKPKFFYSNLNEWKNPFNEAIILKLKNWEGEDIVKGPIHHSKTSPFCAMSLAYNLGANRIILWGVDFVSHNRWRPGHSGYQREVSRYKQYSLKLKEVGVDVYLGSKGSNLNLPIWQNINSF